MKVRAGEDEGILVTGSEKETQREREPERWIQREKWDV